MSIEVSDNQGCDYEIMMIESNMIGLPSIQPHHQSTSKWSSIQKIFCRSYFKDLIYEIRKRTLLYVQIILRTSFLFLFYSSIIPLGFRQPQHIPKYIRSPRPKPSVVIICCYNCKLDSFILNGLNFFGPIVHVKHSVKQIAIVECSYWIISLRSSLTLMNGLCLSPPPLLQLDYIFSV